MIQKLTADEFMTMACSHPVFDVRSPGEYAHAHIPGAHSLPLFSDEERKVVGTLYKQEGREIAIKKGLDYFGVKMRTMVEAAEKVCSERSTQGHQGTVLVHCWRGGMRSAGVAWLLDLYGFKVCTLAGGYKAFRNWVLAQFGKSYPFAVVGGYTGSGKTRILQELANKGHAVIDLERIARHKGSAFGALGEEKQPGHEQFENLLALELYRVSRTHPDRIWIEDESRRIGDVNLPQAFWNIIRSSPLYFVDVPFEERLNYIAKEYGKFRKDDLISAIVRIQKRLGGLNTKNAINFLLEDNHKESFRILLKYYDKYYGQDLESRQQITRLETDTVDATINAGLVTNAKQKVWNK